MSSSALNLVLHAGALPWRAIVLGAGLVLASGAALAASPMENASQTCVGDCDDSGTVTLDEIVKGLKIALGSLSLDQCRRFDCHGSGRATLDCIIRAVEATLNGCGPGPTASPMRTRTPAPTSTATPTSTPSPTHTSAATMTPRATATPQPGDALTVFDSRSAFASAAGALLTDDYEDPGYAEFQDDASMDAVKGLTRYRTTLFPDFDEVIATPNGHIYAGGLTSGSFQLDFTASSLGGSGVRAVGFDFANNTAMPYVAFVSFADGTSRNLVLHASPFQFLSPPPDFLGLTSTVEITRIHIGLMDGGATSANLFTIDNLSVAASETATRTATRSTTPTATQTATIPPSSTATSTSTATATPSPTPTPSPTRAPIDEAVLAASVRVATEPLFRLFDFQDRVGTPGGVAGRSIISGCQQFDCVAFGHVTGTEEDCCSDTQFTQVFDHCGFDDELGRFVSLTGAFVLNTDSVNVCTGAIPLGARFTASLSGFTYDVLFPDGGFSSTFRELTETFEVTTGGCTVRQPEQLGFAVRGDGRRFIDGELQQFRIDRFGNVLLNTETDVHALEIAVGSTGQPESCTVTAALNGSLTSADFRLGTQFRTDFTDFQVIQPPEAGALLLGLNGEVGTDCLGDVALTTVEALRVAPGDTCPTAGRLRAQLENGTVSATYADSGLDLDFGADGSTDRHFATCGDVPADQCATSTVGLCGACTALSQCQTGLGCFPCSSDCSGSTSRCSLAHTLVTCEDGIF